MSCLKGLKVQKHSAFPWMKTSVSHFSSFKRAASCSASDKVRGLKAIGNDMSNYFAPLSTMKTTHLLAS